MPDRERALAEEEALFAGVAGSETVGEAPPRDLLHGGREIYLRVAESLPGRAYSIAG